MTPAQAKGPVIIRAFRHGKWEESTVEAHANVGTLKELKQLGYEKIVVETELDIESILKAREN